MERKIPSVPMGRLQVMLQNATEAVWWEESKGMLPGRHLYKKYKLTVEFLH
jgi:hypothetical protein